MFKIQLGGASTQHSSSIEDYQRFNQVLLNFQESSKPQFLKLYNSYFAATSRTNKPGHNANSLDWIVIIPVCVYIVLTYWLASLTCTKMADATMFEQNANYSSSNQQWQKGLLIIQETIPKN